MHAGTHGRTNAHIHTHTNIFTQIVQAFRAVWQAPAYRAETLTGFNNPAGPAAPFRARLGEGSQTPALAQAQQGSLSSSFAERVNTGEADGGLLHQARERAENGERRAESGVERVGSLSCRDACRPWRGITSAGPGLCFSGELR